MQFLAVTYIGGARHGSAGDVYAAAALQADRRLTGTPAWLTPMATLRFTLELGPVLFRLRSQPGKPLRGQVANELRRREGGGLLYAFRRVRNTPSASEG